MNFVILCGGSGSRLWPKSREKLPKQLLKLTNQYTMLQNTLLRVEKIIDDKTIADYSTEKNVYIICNKEHSHIIERQIEELNIPFMNHNVRIINEPIGRDSAPAICISSLLDSSQNITCIIPSDHVFNDDEFANSYKHAIGYTNNAIVTFGIRPSHPETGYGYIKFNSNTYETENFVEKPDYESAVKYLESGEYFWNGGVFVFKNETMLQCFQKYAPDILKSCIHTLAITKMDSRIIQLNPIAFNSTRAISVDYAIMENLCNDDEKTVSAFTVPYNYYWNDIGSFSALYEECEKDDNENVVKGDCITLDTNNCYVESETMLISTIGVSNLIIVQTDDAVLVCNKNQSQNVKKVVEKLKKYKREEATLHKRVYRPWGWYVNVHGNDNGPYKMKSICVYPGKRLSLQSHNKRCEHWVIATGIGKFQLDDAFTEVKSGDHVYIPTYAKHRIENIGNELLEFTETQIGDYLGEDDIVRYEDDFGRV